MKRKRLISITFCALIVFSGAVIIFGCAAGNKNTNREPVKQSQAFECDATMVSTIWTIIKTNFYKQPVLDETLFKGAIDALLQMTNQLPETAGEPKYNALTLWKIIESLASQNKDFSKSNLCYGALVGMAANLKNPYTRFYPPQKAKNKLKYLSNSRVGIGVKTEFVENPAQSQEGQLVIQEVLPASPAEKGGLKIGDIILKINDILITAKNYQEALTSFSQKPVGALINITLRKAETKETKTVILALEEITEKAAKCEIIDEIPYCRIVNFHENAANDFFNALLTMAAFFYSNDKGETGPLDKIIIDLRNNPGGSLDEVQAIMSMAWLDGKQLLSLKNDSEGTKNYLGPWKLAPFLDDAKTIILMNRQTASAAEILAAILSEGNKALLIGEKSYGKGQVQHWYPFPDGSLLILTTFEWLTPNEKNIEGTGLMPDIPVKSDSQNIFSKDNSQLKKAIELLKNPKKYDEALKTRAP